MSAASAVPSSAPRPTGCTPRLAEPSGHVFLRQGKRGGVWYAKYRLPDGRQVKKRIGPAGPMTRRKAEAWLRDYRGSIRTHLLPWFGGMRVEDITPEHCEAWAAGFGGGRKLSSRTKVKVTTILLGIMERARGTWKLPRNPVADLEKPVQRRRVDIEVFSPEEVLCLVRAAESEQDAAIFLTAAFTGLRRGELVALRWRDVDFTRSHLRVRASYTDGARGPSRPSRRLSCSAPSRRGWRCGRDDRSCAQERVDSSVGDAISKRCHLTRSTSASRPAGPRLALACSCIRALLRA